MSLKLNADMNQQTVHDYMYEQFHTEGAND